MPILVPSTDGVAVAVHDLGGSDDRWAPVVLFAHGTGFHGRAFAPMATHLADRVRCVALDLRGHGVAATPAGLAFGWRGFAEDVVAVLDSGVLSSGGPLIGVGHSLGGAALVAAAAARPEAFRGLWLFEPVIPPPGAALSSDGPNPLADGAGRRRSRFDSLDAAIANYQAKRPLDELHPDALRAYVEGGFATEADGSVVLRCRPAWEAATFRMARSGTAWAALPELELPIVVGVGRDEPYTPSAYAAGIAERARHGRLSRHPELGHFGPLEDPEAIAEEVAVFVAACAKAAHERR